MLILLEEVRSDGAGPPLPSVVVMRPVCLHVSLTAVCQTGVPSSDPRQSHRVHPVHEEEKPHPPAGHRRPEEAECATGATSPSSGEGEGLLPAAEQLPVLRQQPVHQPQRQRRVGLRRRLRLQLRVRGGGAPQQEEAALGGQLEGRAGVRQGGIGGVPSVLGPPCLGSHRHCPLRGMKRALGCCCPPPPATQTIQTREAAWPCLNSTPHPLSCRRGRAGMHCFILFVQTVCTNPQRSSFSEGGELFVSDSRVLERFYEVLEDVPARRTAANISLGV